MPKHVVSVSGGKDSTCTYLLAMERGKPFQAVFADTGNEHPWTLEFVDRLAERTGGPPVQVVRADLAPKFPRKRETIRTKWPSQGVAPEIVERALSACHPTGIPFLDACILRSGFPTHSRQFCTDYLKIQPIKQQVYEPIWAERQGVISWRGVRREESLPRSQLPMFARLSEGGGRLVRYLPLIEWKLAAVWKLHRRHGLEPNPLYRHGMTRVGCFPCIYLRKAELRALAERFPEHIDRIREWEAIVQSVHKSIATFFPMTRGGGKGVDAWVEWSKTTYGGRQYSLLPIDDIRVELGRSCGEWGACE